MPHPTAARMADVMQDRTAANGYCTEIDLRTAGFTGDEITQHHEAAASLTRRMSERQQHPISAAMRAAAELTALALFLSGVWALASITTLA